MIELLDTFKDAKRLTDAELACILGVKVATVWNWRRVGELPDQVVSSIEAHMALSASAFNRIKKERLHV